MNTAPAPPHLTLPQISYDANKYTRGCLLVLAGSQRYFGAGVLATLSAEKTGAGYVSLATPASAALNAKQHLLCSPVIEAPEGHLPGTFAAHALPALLQGLHRADAICCGPGITINQSTVAFVEEVLQHASRENIPLLLDADALGVLAARPELLKDRRLAAKTNDSQGLAASRLNPLILTPHQGELKRLHAAFIDEVKSTRPAASDQDSTKDQSNSTSLAQSRIHETIEAATALAEALSAIVVAKGPVTIIAGGGEHFESSEATPALAKAGTGDVLAGVISSLVAQGLPAKEASLLGVRIHSLAGVQAELGLGRRSVTALDVIAAIPWAIAQFEAEQRNAGM
ncbi:MAG: NAD(P)H-hydrate dehydratase [Coriobacteriales bacterium]|jgi:NAD(P)H-hydrate epimerase|nr:NAD(P)H-hydrate dehydratase [Coriobacteriales bacterium]